MNELERQVRRNMSKKFNFRFSTEEAYSLIAFIKNHEREEIPDDVWELCEALEDFYDFYESWGEV